MKNNPVEENRIGKVRIESRYIHTDFDLLLEISKKFVVVRCEHMFSDNRLHYIGYSYDFEPVEMGMEAPEYQVEIQQEDENGEREIKFKAIL